MQWDASPNGGFTQGEPWLPLVDPATRNVADQSRDPGSLLQLYRHLLALRRRSPALRHGSLELLDGLPPGAIGWIREEGDDRILVIANMGDERRVLDLSSVAPSGEVIADTGSRHGRLPLDGHVLEPLEGFLLRL
jgi:glycosidase